MGAHSLWPKAPGVSSALRIVARDILIFVAERREWWGWVLFERFGLLDKDQVIKYQYLP
jgi:hypothetical protein